MNNLEENQTGDEEDVQNDAVIASAFRASLLVIMLLCIAADSGFGLCEYQKNKREID